MRIATRLALSGDKTIFGDGKPGSGWGCSRCRGKAWKEQDPLRADRNCDGKHPSAGARLHFPWAPELRRCPWAATSEQAWRYVRLWQRWKVLNVLPEPGDILDQPADIARAIEVCEWTRLEVEGERAEHQQRAEAEAEKGRR